MKALMISIQPKWCKLIANGEKTIEVRKTRPNIETPFKCYIYCTKSKPEIKIRLADFILDIFTPIEQLKANGKIIGSFVCNKIIAINPCFDCYDILEKTCLTSQEMHEYGKDRVPYAWHISDLKIYDKPKEPSEFKSMCKDLEIDCLDCPYYNYKKGDCGKTITRPPRSWQYCGELEENDNE